jgi:ketol-acid reductoisomerase
VYKVFSKVIEEKIAPDLEDNNILGESQGASPRFRQVKKGEIGILVLLFL